MTDEHATRLRWTDGEALDPEAFAGFLGPGGFFELVEEDVLGARLAVFANRQPSIGAMVEAAAGHGDRPFLVEGDRTVTFADLPARVAGRRRPARRGRGRARRPRGDGRSPVARPLPRGARHHGPRGGGHGPQPVVDRRRDGPRRRPDRTRAGGGRGRPADASPTCWRVRRPRRSPPRPSPSPRTTPPRSSSPAAPRAGRRAPPCRTATSSTSAGRRQRPRSSGGSSPRPRARRARPGAPATRPR